MAAPRTVKLTDLELHMAIMAVDNMKDDEERPTRRKALLRLHDKLMAARKAVRA